MAAKLEATAASYGAAELFTMGCISLDAVKWVWQSRNETKRDDPPEMLMSSADLYMYPAI